MCGSPGLVGWWEQDVFTLPRPPTPPVRRLEEDYAQEHGFPSAHSGAASSLPIFAVLYFVQNADGATAALSIGIAVLYCLTVSLSRLYVGVHSFTDVFGGWIIGVSTVVLWERVKLPVDAWLLHSDYGTLGMHMAPGLLIVCLLVCWFRQRVIDRRCHVVLGDNAAPLVVFGASMLLVALYPRGGRQPSFDLTMSVLSCSVGTSLLLLLLLPSLRLLPLVRMPVRKGKLVVHVTDPFLLRVMDDGWHRRSLGHVAARGRRSVVLCARVPGGGLRVLARRLVAGGSAACGHRVPVGAVDLVRRQVGGVAPDWLPRTPQGGACARSGAPAAGPAGALGQGADRALV